MAVIEVSTANGAIALQPTFEPLDTYRVPPTGPTMAIKHDYTVTVKEDVSTIPQSITPVKEAPGLYITGLGSQYPPFQFPPEKLEGFVKRWYDLDTPG